MKNTDREIVRMLYGGTTTIQSFNWDNMKTVPLMYLVTKNDIDEIRNLILHPKYSGNNRIKMKMIDEILGRRGFTRLAGGTNRLVYTHNAAPNAVFKVGIDSIGITDNPAEFYNQKFLKPYCTKVFECTPCGTMASFERVDRILSFDEFYSIADDYYYLITKKIIGKYVMEDIGIDYFMNFGIRRGCYPVILDFPYLFELDGSKLYCQKILDDGSVCNGEIDYDAGFNHLVCEKCGAIHSARELAKPPKYSSMLTGKKGEKRMTINIMKGDTVIKTITTDRYVDSLSPNNKDIRDNGKGPIVVIERNKVAAPKQSNRVITVQPHTSKSRNTVITERHNTDTKVVIEKNDLEQPKEEKTEDKQFRVIDPSVSPIMSLMDMMNSFKEKEEDTSANEENLSITDFKENDAPLDVPENDNAEVEAAESTSIIHDDIGDQIVLTGVVANTSADKNNKTISPEIMENFTGMTIKCGADDEKKEGGVAKVDTIEDQMIANMVMNGRKMEL